MAEEPLTDTPESPEALVSTDQVADLQRERDDYQDRWMRKSAEFDNYRKRIERERREQADQKVVDLLLELLLVVDDFDRALTVDAAEVTSYRKGVELIHTKLQDLLRKHNVKPIDSARRRFRSQPSSSRRPRGQRRAPGRRSDRRAPARLYDGRSAAYGRRW